MIGATAGDSIYLPPAGTFRKLPSGHVSCFPNCHWDKDEPKKENCAGCHFSMSAFTSKRQSALSVLVTQSFNDWPREWPRRLSLKFNHDSKNHREQDNPELICIACHTTIRQAEPLVKPDVPISTCAQSGCHFEKASRTSIRKEMLAEDGDIASGRNNDPLSRAGQNTCTGCHTSAIGSLPPPCSHLRMFGETYFSAQDYPSSGKQLEARCKK